MRFEAFIAGRYLRGKRRNRFVSLITFISVAGVAVGVMALIVVMSVMTGFDEALRETIIGNRSGLVVQDPFGLPLAEDSPRVRELLDDAPEGSYYDALSDAVAAASPEIVAAAPFIEIEAVLKTPDNGNQRHKPAQITGVDMQREQTVTQIAENLTGANGRLHGAGELPGRRQIMLGYILAHDLGVWLGDRVAVVTLKTSGTPFGLSPVQQVWLEVSGISQAQMGDYDTLRAWVDIETAQLLKDQRGIDGIHCKLRDHFRASQAEKDVEDVLGLEATTWYQSQQAFFEALQQEKVIMFIILAFIILVAAFNITSTLIMIVMEKRRDIGILRTIGTPQAAVLRLFMLEGVYIGLSGTLAGLVLGIAIAANINLLADAIAWMLGLPALDPTIYYFDRIPAVIVWSDVAWIMGAAVILTFVSTLYPAWSAARVDPVDALRNE